MICVFFRHVTIYRSRRLVIVECNIYLLEICEKNLVTILPSGRTRTDVQSYHIVARFLQAKKRRNAKNLYSSRGDEHYTSISIALDQSDERRTYSLLFFTSLILSYQFYSLYIARSRYTDDISGRNGI